MSAARVFFVGGLTSYRALFGFLSPWVFVPSLMVAPVFQILLFAYIGRSAGLESDAFYVVGNAIQFASVPCLFAMTQTIAGELTLSSKAGWQSAFGVSGLTLHDLALAFQLLG